jgi:hypothetical protein
MWISQRLTIMYSILMSPQVPEQHSQNHSSLSCVRLARMKLCGCESANSHWILKLKCTLLRRVTKIYFQYTDVNNFKTRMHKHPRYLTYNLPLYEYLYVPLVVKACTTCHLCSVHICKEIKQSNGHL